MFLPFSLILSKSSSNSIIGSTHSFHSTSFNDHWIFNAYSVCLFQTPYHHSLVIDLGSNHPLTRFHYLITTHIGFDCIFQSFVVSMLKVKKGINEKSPDRTETIEFDSMFKIEMCYTWSFFRLVTIEWRLSSEWAGLYWIVS